MQPKDTIHIKNVLAPYYPHALHCGIILEETPHSSTYWHVLWSDGSTGDYHASIIMIGWYVI